MYVYVCAYVCDVYACVNYIHVRECVSTCVCIYNMCVPKAVPVLVRR